MLKVKFHLHHSFHNFIFIYYNISRIISKVIVKYNKYEATNKILEIYNIHIPIQFTGTFHLNNKQLTTLKLLTFN